MLLERNNDMPKEPMNRLNFNSEKVKSVSSEEFNTNVDDLLAKRDSIYDEVKYNSSDKQDLDPNSNTNIISNTNQNELDGFSFNEMQEDLNNLSLSPPVEQPSQQQPSQQQPSQQQPSQQQPVIERSQSLKKQIITFGAFSLMQCT